MGGASTRRKAAVAGCLGLAMLVVAACGGGGDDGGSSDGKTVRLIVSEGDSLPFIAAEAGEELGVWDDKGIDVKIIDGTSATVGPSIASGNAEIGLGTGVKAASDIVAGLDATLTAGDVLPWDQYVIASEKSGATEPADLKGKKIGISSFGSAGHFATLTVAKNLGWSESDYEIVPLGNLEGLLGALRSGTIDAFVWSIETVLTAVDEGFGKNLGSVADIVGPNAFEAFLVSNDYADEHPENVKAFFEGYYEAVAKLQADPDWAKKYVVDEWKKDPKVADEAVDLLLPILSKDGKIPPENLDGLSDAVHTTVDGIGDFDINSIYRYWKDL
jgi:ABC-type nitrate/sulfonate/bicarbonate transport system substrate-binding protein